jgi:hypothetical protein
VALDPEFLTRFQAGEAIPVSESAFPALEDTLVHELLPFYDNQMPAHRSASEAQWQSRDRLLDAMRGPKFFGRLINPVVQKQPDPLAKLIESKKIPVAFKSALDSPENLLGIEVAANIKSSSAAITGVIARSIWYLRTAPGSSAYRGQKLWIRHVGDNYGGNTIEEALAWSRRTNPHNTRLSRGNRTGTHRVPNK